MISILAETGNYSYHNVISLWHSVFISVQLGICLVSHYKFHLHTFSKHQ